MTWPRASLFLLLLGTQHFVEIGLYGVQGNVIVPGLPQKSYAQLGDVNIGVLLPMTEAGNDSQRYCNEDITFLRMALYAEVISSLFLCDAFACMLCRVLLVQPVHPHEVPCRFYFLPHQSIVFLFNTYQDTTSSNKKSLTLSNFNNSINNRKTNIDHC